MEEEYRDQLRLLSAQLEGIRPNMKSAERCPGALVAVEDAGNKATTAQQEIVDVRQRFEAVRKRRKDLFMACYQKVSKEIGGIYKRLTANSYGPGQEGGTAYVDLDDLEEPYNGGVKFTAMPPYKRFADITQLSGGERSLAALALLFAVRAWQQPLSFLVLDEVDAHLDRGNVEALASYVQQSNTQMIVVSHREKLYSRCEGLVGISRDKRNESSVVLTVDLAQFRRPQGIISDAGG